MIRGVVFDMDDTLVSSSLSLDEIRRELGIPGRSPILEYIESLPWHDQEIAHATVLRHELRAAKDAQLIPGVEGVLLELEQRGIPVGLLTRNCLAATHQIIQRLGLRLNPIVTRECAPPKPDPTGLRNIVQGWGLTPPEVIYVGDLAFDIQVGQNAGVRTALYAPRSRPPCSSQADFVFSHYQDFLSILDQ